MFVCFSSTLVMKAFILGAAFGMFLLFTSLLIWAGWRTRNP